MYKAVIIDDKQIIVKGLSMLIDWPANGFELAGTAFKGYKAMELIKTIHPDLVVSDIELGDMTGLELMARSQAIGLDCQFIFISAYDDFNYCKTAISLGAIDYLLKPVETEVLVSALGKACKRIHNRQLLKMTDPVQKERQKSVPSDNVIDHINAYIDEHYYDNLDLTLLSKEFYLSTSYLSELFKKENGINFKKYLTKVRIEKAKRYLTETNYNFSMIASKVGYDSPNYFSQVLKKATGYTPSEYRNLFEKDHR